MTWRTRKDRIDKRTGQPVRYQQYPDKGVLPTGLTIVSPPRQIKKPKGEEQNVETVYRRTKQDFKGGIMVDDPILDRSVCYRYNSSLSGEARAYTYRDEIHVGDKFFELDYGARRFILLHERSHFVADELLAGDNFWLVSDSGIFGEAAETREGKPYYKGILSTFNTDEAVTEAFALYIDDPDELKERHPKAYEFFELVMDGDSVSDAVIRVLTPIRSRRVVINGE